MTPKKQHEPKRKEEEHVNIFIIESYGLSKLLTAISSQQTTTLL